MKGCNFCSTVTDTHLVDGVGYCCSFCTQMVPRSVLTNRNNTNKVYWIIGARVANWINDKGAIAND